MKIKSILHKHHSQITEGEWKVLEREGIVNGIGPSSMPLLRFLLNKISPSFIYSEARKHDLGYYIGLTEERRKECDIGFYNSMISDIFHNEYSLGKTIYYSLLAVTYYYSVRLLGKKHFNYFINRFV